MRPPLFLCRVCCTTNHLLLAWDREERWRRGWAGSSKERHPRVRWVKGQGNGHLRDQGFLLPSLPPTFALTRLITCLPCWDTGCQCTFCVDFIRYRNFARETCWLLLRMVGSWCALTFPSRRYHRSLDFPPLVAAKGHKAYSVMKQEWGPVPSHTIVQHCLLSSCTELPLKSIQDAYGTFLERDINQKYIHSRGVCVCRWMCAFVSVCMYVCVLLSFLYIYIYFYTYIYIKNNIYVCQDGRGDKESNFLLPSVSTSGVNDPWEWRSVNTRLLFHLLVWESNVKAAGIPKPCLRILATCVSAIYSAVYVEPTLHTRTHTHTPESVFVHLCGYI